MRVLVFDSGVGGLSVVQAVQDARLPIVLDYLADNAFLPYGAKSPEELRARTPALIHSFVERWRPAAVIIACNTASTLLLPDLRARLSVPVIGVVPPIKPAAAASKTRVIGLLATPATVLRPYTEDLIASFAADCRVLRHGALELVAAAEDKLSGRPPDPELIRKALDGLLRQEGGDRIDMIALACTHFPLLREDIAAVLPVGVQLVDSGAAIARRLASVLNLEPGKGAELGAAAFTSDADPRFAGQAAAFERLGFTPILIEPFAAPNHNAA